LECDFEAAILGSYDGKMLTEPVSDGRVCDVPYDHANRAWRAWDPGYGDATAVWFAQVIGKELGRN
jgi:hypothetical protein